MGKCRHGSYAKSAVSGSCYQCKIKELERKLELANLTNEIQVERLEELEAEVYDATVLEHNLKSILKIKEAQLDEVRPYIQHTPNCPVNVIHYAFAPVCDCGLQAILENDDE